MSYLASTFHGITRRLNLKSSPVWLRRAMWGIIPLASALSFYAISASSPFLPINLSAVPLYAKGAGIKPTISLALSVEFPTVGAQYRDTYANTTEYIGYFDADSCYAYVNDGNINKRRFDRTGAAAVRECAGTGFSGNFMNWATGSAIDVLRLGLTGGDRIVDDNNMTVLQRAVIQKDFWNNGTYFPAKTLPAALVNGAVPTSLKGTFNGDIKIANCLNRVHFGTATGGSCDAPGTNSNLGVAGGVNGTATLTSDNFFYARVQVCESSASTLQDPRVDYCLKYPNNKFKPVGNLQKHSDSIRVAAFGYLMDNEYTRYGGVLRAPMKFIGPQAYDANGSLVAGTNPQIEWDPATGVFLDNPDNNTTAIAGTLNNGLNSGVINYLNKFGRTGATPGVYKGYDPVSELYYESLRYVQGLPPTPVATAGMTTAMQDGYPAYTAWTDPHAGGSKDKDYSCLRNNIILVGDVNTHGDKTIPGNTRVNGPDLARAANPAGNEPDFVFWTKVVGGFESNTSVSYPFGNLATNPTTSNPNPPNAARWGMENQNTGSSNAAYYMAGMAYWANTHDIRGTTWTSDVNKQRPGMRVKTYVIDVNEGSADSVAAARRNTQFFLTAKYGGFDDVSGKGNPFLDANGATDNNIWQKPADPGEAKNYYLASSAKAVIAGLNQIFDTIDAEGNTIANGSISTTSFTTGGFLYSARYDASKWTGDVVSTPVSANSGVINIGVNTPQWKAATVLDAKPNSFFTTTRKIFAGRSRGNMDGATAAIPFDWTSVSGDNGVLKTALDKPTPASSADGLAQKRVEYLRGDKTTETASPFFRSRSSKLGDIANSPVVYSKDFANNINTTAYKTFVTSNTARPGALFVGANDGMMHAFNAANGEELFAYIPSWLADKLPALTDPTYNTTKHQSYVDGQTDVAEALINSNWKTVLVSSTGGGGQGVFALDVSNPSTFDASKAIWEFSDRDDADLGNVVGTPKIVKMRTNKKSAITPTYEWFVVVAGGVNNFVNDGYVSSSGKPYLFLLSLNKAAGTAWTAGSNYFKFEIPTDSTLSTTVSPGLINFEATAGLSGEIDQIYAGDLHGNLWKLDFDLASDGASGKDLVNTTFANLTSGTSYKPLFVAKDSLGNVQPITMTPKVISGPNKGSIVLFGTGKYLEATDNDPTPVRTQSVYAINDTGATGFIPGRDRLQAGTMTGTNIAMPSFIWGRASSATDATQRSGWYFDYAAVGERQNTNSEFTVSGNNVYFGSLIPPQNITDPCGGGGGNFYNVNFATGNGNGNPSEAGLIGQIFIQETTTAAITTSDSADRRTKTTTKRMLIKGSNGYQTPPTDIIDSSVVGRLSWRQINNYQELKNAP